MSKFINKISKFSIIGLSTLVPTLVFAQAANRISTLQDLFVLFNSLLKTAVGILIFLASVFIVIAAFKYLTGKGEPEEIKKAQKIVVWAVIAIVVAVFAWAIPKIVLNFMGITDLRSVTNVGTGGGGTGGGGTGGGGIEIGIGN